MDRVEAVVVGAGVVGLAVARKLAERGMDTLLLEREAGIGSGISSRNSEVLHAGFYDPTGSLKAELCLRGRHLLMDYCAARGIGHARCGKFVVAAEAGQQAQLQALLARGRHNGVEDLEIWDGAAARRAEPALAAHAVLHSPATAIVDSHALMLSLLADFERAGGVFVARAEVQQVRPQPGGGFVLQVGGSAPGNTASLLACEQLVNAAGLGAWELAQAIEGLPAAALPARHLAKGSYFSLSGRAPFSRLIYPLPEAGGLGVHLTLDLAGQARFGPDVEWLSPDALPDDQVYRVDPARAPAFEAAVRRFWPALPAGRLQPAYAGVRPKLSGPSEPAADFLLQDGRTHGLPGLWQLFGIESPGLTASLAIAERLLRDA